MPSLTPLDATHHKSIVCERGDDIHNINFTVGQLLQSIFNLRSRVTASLAEQERSRVESVVLQGKQTFDKFRKKYQPIMLGKNEKVLTSEEAYWIFFALSGSDFDKSVQMADDMTKSLQHLEEIVIFLETKQRNVGLG